MIKIKYNKLPLQGAYLLAIFVSLMLDSRFSLPFHTVLRWVMPAVLWFLVYSQRKRLPIIQNVLFWIVLLWFGVTCLTGANIPYSVQRYVSLLLICGTFYSYYYFLAENNRLLDAIAVMGVLYVIYGVLNFFFIQWGSGERPTGLTGNANSLGGFGNISMIFSYYFYRRAKRRKRLFWLAIIMSAVCAWASASRSATICMLLILSGILFIQIKGKARIVFLLVGILLAMGLLLLDNDILLVIPGLRRLAENGVISSERETMWVYGLSLVRQRPVLGWGYGVSMSLNAVEKGLAFHNSYLSTAIETGVIGVSILMLFLVIAIVKGCKLFAETRCPELLTILAILLDYMLIFYGESSMMSVGGSEGFLFWGCVMWLLVAEKKMYQTKETSYALGKKLQRPA